MSQLHNWLKVFLNNYWSLSSGWKHSRPRIDLCSIILLVIGTKAFYIILTFSLYLFIFYATPLADSAVNWNRTYGLLCSHTNLHCKTGPSGQMALSRWTWLWGHGPLTHCYHQTLKCGGWCCLLQNLCRLTIIQWEDSQNHSDWDSETTTDPLYHDVLLIWYGNILTISLWQITQLASVDVIYLRLT